MRLIAPAKINWTLEVLGARDDGYHEVRSVLQTIALCDVVHLEPAKELTLLTDGSRSPSEDDLALLAARLLAEAVGRLPKVAIRLTKRIPAAAGLGGGSSDAAAVLRGLDRLWGLGLGQAVLAQMASRLGSDVPFFLFGGTALAQGRGERITPLPDCPIARLVLLVPPFSLPEKTRRLYQALTPADFGDGSHTQALVRGIHDGGRIDDDCLYNCFRRAAFVTFEGLAAYEAALLAAGARRVHLAGSGPALFALAGDWSADEALRGALSALEAQVFVVRTLAAREALAVAE